MPLTTIEWHQRFTQQTHWTSALRHYILQKTQLIDSDWILEVGSGTGALLSALQSAFSPDATKHHFGLDINKPFLQYSRNQLPDVKLTQGDGHHLPYHNASFDAVTCHFLLLWVHNPGLLLEEMARVTRPNGYVIAFAEPDYGGRIDYPLELVEIGKLQTMSLKQQGADTNLGRKLAGLFSNAGLTNIEFGILGGQWDKNDIEDANQSEWAMIKDDLNGLISNARIDQLRQLDFTAQSEGARVLFIPTFYAYGQVPDLSK